MIDESLQKTTLQVVFDVKQLFAREFYLVVGGYLIDMMYIQVHPSISKPISVQLLHVILYKAVLKQLCLNIRNYFPNSDKKIRCTFVNMDLILVSMKCAVLLLERRSMDYVTLVKGFITIFQIPYTRLFFVRIVFIVMFVLGLMNMGNITSISAYILMTLLFAPII